MTAVLLAGALGGITGALTTHAIHQLAIRRRRNDLDHILRRDRALAGLAEIIGRRP